MSGLLPSLPLDPSRRRSRAKKTRESRKATQPVPENLMEQLQQDALERERQEDRSIADHKVDMTMGSLTLFCSLIPLVLWLISLLAV